MGTKVDGLTRGRIHKISSTRAASWRPRHTPRVQVSLEGELGGSEVTPSGECLRGISMPKGRDLHLNGVLWKLLWPAEGQSVLSTAGELMETQDLPGASYRRQACHRRAEDTVTV